MSADEYGTRAEYATFGLAPATRAGGVLSNGSFQAHRDFWDFVVDGTPLLLRLADLDAVSPLAADLGPSIFTAHVRRLLLESGAPLAGGRYVIYGCPECEGLACGAVTAVIERDGPDIVWRDFLWQTAETPDPERDGYHGIGPYRFRGEEYRAQLGRLLAADGEACDPAAPPRRVLLVGQRVAVLAKLAAALRAIGIGAEISRDAAGADADELRTYGAVAFGRAIDEGERAAVREAFAAAGADAVFVDGLPPIIPLLVARIEQALDRTPEEQRRLRGLRTAERGSGHGGGPAAEVVVDVAMESRVELVGYRLDRLHRTRVHELADQVLEPGTHRVPLPTAGRGELHVVARATGSVLVAPARR
ncbi:oxidoreductase [Streptomyces sp. LX-29]|uniref:oxidoreductase n=1 Tax=Streptomyces sp. LX-29 TaxID=2900152 RepID=UPI00240DD4AD|nr:oxidoreductase [Streptomyces sp. LX-29]WFB06698.1 oxidoreductase [Streptomyces sp. LX-29]